MVAGLAALVVVLSPGLVAQSPVQAATAGSPAPVVKAAGAQVASPAATDAELDAPKEVVKPGYNLNTLKAGQAASAPKSGSTVTAGRTVSAAGVVSAAAVNPCAPLINPVACENSLPGDAPSDWSVEEPGDQTIQGFATDQSVNAGQTIQFKVLTPASSYHIDILRLGWYGGDGARKVAANILPSVALPQSQPACQVDTSNTTGLVDCGNWNVSASWSVPANAVSGVYFAHLVRNDTGGDSAIFFVVRNDASTSAIVYQTSDVTREAYNQYDGNNYNPLNPGNSLYVCTINCPPGNPAVYKAAYKVSFNRPNVAAILGGQYSVFGAEFQMIEFLEANGYDVSYISGVDTDRAGALLTHHRLFISSGHDEYWSGAQRTNVEAAEAAGVNLAFFSANEVFWKVRYENSVAGTATAYRTLVSYKETHFTSPVDPQDPSTWTGTWRDPTFSPPADGGKPENALTGTAYTVDPPNTFAIQVPSTYSALRFWRGTAVASLGAGQTATLAPSSLGYEWDEDLDNGFRPAGNFDLSSTTQSVTAHLVDYGNTEIPGTATHHLTMHRAASGALVFGAGTVQWSWGLEGSPDGTAGPNLSMEQATINLFADMGLQPGTLIGGLVSASASADHTAPASTITAPTSGSAIADGTTVTVSGTATDAGGGVVAGVEVSTDGGATWHPAPIAAAKASTTWTYTWNVATSGSVNLKVRATDDSANLETPGAGTTVTVNCPCSLFPSSTTPRVADAGDAASIEVGVRFTSSTSGYISGVRFYKAATNTGTHVGELWSASGQLLASATFTNETASGWQTVSFAQSVPVTPGTSYVASYFAPNGHYAADAPGFSGTGVSSPPLAAPKAASGVPNGVYAYAAKAGTFPSQTFGESTYGGDNYYADAVFTPNSGPPFLAGESPAPGSTNQSTVAPIKATFSKDVKPATIVMTVTDASHNAVAGTVSYDSPSTTATFTPTAALAASTTYTVNVSGATDAQGNTMTPAAWSFTTFACPCSLWSSATVPGRTDSGDGSSLDVGVRFSSNVSGYIYGVRFYKAVTNTGTHTGSLWSSTGSLLAQGTFSAETASGWQQLTFANPVPITANTVYVVSYHTNTGHYSADSGYFATAVTNGPLQAPASSSGGNGMYAYAATPTFPASTYNSTNYWVDPVFDVKAPTNTAPTVTSTTPAANATGVSVATKVTATFNQAVQSGTITFALTDANHVAVPASLSYDLPSQTATLTPGSSLVAGATYTASVSGAQNIYGTAMAAPATWSFTTAAASCPCTIWPSTATPTVASASDSSNIELGVRFQADRNGYITGVRFYKGPTNTGTHVGNLWSANGTLLATGTFANETATGWQELDFANAVAVTAGTTYTASYHTSVGGYAYSSSYFTAQVDSSPLHALAASNGGNGMYALGASSFPNQTFNATNYWVDTVFNTTGSVRTTPPVVTSTTPASGASGVALSAALTATFDEAVNPATLSFTLTGPAGALTGATSWNATTRTATFTPSAPLAILSSYTAGVQATDLSGNAMPAPTTWSFTSAAPACPCTVFAKAAVPGIVDSGDGTALELGVKFQPTVSGFVTGLRFYKSAANTGVHTGSLWSSTGTLIATATFTAESGSGWQDVSFSSPVAVTAGTTYVASYHTTIGHYSYDGGYFANNGAGSAPVQALSNSVAGGNGVFAIGASAFPSQTFNASNYWVDPIFDLNTGSVAPSAVATTPAPGATGVLRATSVVSTFSEGVNPSTISLVVKDSGGNVVSGSVSYDPGTLVATFQPAAALAASTTYSATVSGAVDLAGHTMVAPVAWSFTTGTS